MSPWNQKAVRGLLSTTGWLLGVIVAFDASIAPNMLAPDFYKQHSEIVIIGTVGIILLAFVVFLMEQRAKHEAESRVRTSSPPKGYGPREALISHMRRQWVEGVLEHSLYALARINLKTYEDGASVARPIELVVPQFVVDNGDAFTPSEVEDGPAMSVIKKLGSFVVLGGPGAGKTTRIGEFVRDLLKDAESDRSCQLPVALRLAHWSERRGPISEWIVREIHARVHVSEKTVRDWINESSLIFLLDGLDEVAVDLRTECIIEINKFRNCSSECAIVVSCRTDDYKELDVKLDLDTALIIRPLAQSMINDALINSGPDLCGLREALESKPELYEVLGSPLMLEVAMVTFTERDRANLFASKNAVELRELLFERYVARMLDPDKRAERPLPRRIRPALRWIARQMKKHDLPFFLRESLHSAGWLSWKQMIFAAGIEGVGACMVVGLVSAVVVGAVGNNLRSHVGGLMGSILGGIVGALIACVLVLFGTAFDTVYTKKLAPQKPAGAAANPQKKQLLPKPSTRFLWGVFQWMKLRMDWLSLSMRWALRLCGLVILFRCVRSFPAGLKIGLLTGASLSVLWGAFIGKWYLNMKESEATGSGGSEVPARAAPSRSLKADRPSVAKNPPAAADDIGGQETGGQRNQSRRWPKWYQIVFRFFIRLLQSLIRLAVMGLFCGFMVLVFALFVLLTPIANFIERTRSSCTRGILWFYGVAPLNQDELLEAATTRALLRRNGAFYEFVHPLLMDYFAKLEGESP